MKRDGPGSAGVGAKPPRRDASELAQPDPPNRVVGRLREHQRGPAAGRLDVLDQVRLVDLVPDAFGRGHRLVALRLKVPAIVVVNKLDKATDARRQEAFDFFGAQPYCKKTVGIAALKGVGIDELLNRTSIEEYKKRWHLFEFPLDTYNKLKHSICFGV